VNRREALTTIPVAATAVAWGMSTTAEPYPGRIEAGDQELAAAGLLPCRVYIDGEYIRNVTWVEPATGRVCIIGKTVEVRTATNPRWHDLSEDQLAPGWRDKILEDRLPTKEIRVSPASIRMEPLPLSRTDERVLGGIMNEKIGGAA